ncbi:hypothetical protein CK203_112631 [Vitis vinifera]|uniref:Uncharacterized protein n=1 Tax=Vitis vinifera TaxID=29760 RepID=A0A438CE43_VITVI|nr:hypothetical protein CK203_112631 [Vitis vinifera]
MRRRFGTRVPLRSTGALICSCETHCEVHSNINFAAAKRIAKLLRKWHFAAKLAFCCETQTDPYCHLFLEPHRPSLRSSSPISNVGQISVSKWREPEGQVFSPSSRKRSLRKEPVPDPIPEPSQPKAIPPPVKPRRQSLRQTLPYQVRGRPLQKSQG